MSKLSQLILKYETSGPRYTSYPTAPHFSPSESKQALIEKALESDKAKSLYIHIPFCKTLCLFCGCSSSVCTEQKKADEYLSLLERELKIWQDRGFKRCDLEQIHFGGGTPNFLSPEQILRLGDIIKSFFEISKTCEFSAELDPRTLALEKVQAFAKIGINRASIGVQDTNPEVQKAILRLQPNELNKQAFEWLRRSGIEHINIDLMYGLPLQDSENFKRTIKDALELKPDRIALFNYAHVPWLKSAQKALEKYPMAQGEEKVALFEEAMEAFENAGFEYIGLDHFAKPEDELIKARNEGSLQRNFQGYSTRAGLDTFAIGLTSISQTRDSYRQNVKIYKDYESSINAGSLPIERGIILTPEDLLRREIIMSIMCNLKLDFKKIESKYNLDFKSTFEKALKNLSDFERDGLIEFGEDSLSVTKLGRLFLRNIAMNFDARMAGEKSRYSKTL